MSESRAWSRWARGVFWVYALVLFTATHWPALRIDGPVPRTDLWAHLGAFGLWALLAAGCGFFGAWRGWKNLGLAWVLGVAYAGADELLQAIPALQRTCAWDDWFADVLGVTLGVGAGALVGADVGVAGWSAGRGSRIVGAELAPERKPMPRTMLFTSESVSMGHPDKVADQISDAVLDAMLADDAFSRVACETLCCTGLVVVAGEVTTKTYVNIPDLVRETVREIGYISGDMRFDADSCGVMVALNKQSPHIAMGVDREGAGDQGMMFGFACKDTPELMPLPIQLSHNLVERQAEARRTGKIPGLRPDAKSQVTVEYDGNKPVRVDTVVLSTQHDPSWNERQAELKKEVTEHIIKPVLGQWWNPGITVHVNPTGCFEIGGPHGDTGLTGRKIIVDSYGGMGRHGGGAFSGKDPTKVDRSAAYMARYIAKNIVAAGLAERCEIQLSYAIGVAEPTSVYVDCFGTNTVDEGKISKAVRDNFRLTPKGIIETLKLRSPIYSATARHGHFGRKPYVANYVDPVKRKSSAEKYEFFTWEKTDKAEALKKACS